MARFDTFDSMGGAGFNIEGQQVVMATQYVATVSEGELRSGVDSLAEQLAEISATLDMLFLSF
tara:strand:+ start:449 stop:637 length:189 start_codon:yes stop_codon:yes gene_type:complete